jgi:ADP-ribosyl-[dinitrogen reductase] hydrolase
MLAFERYRGCLPGLVVGDPVGTTVEFRSAGTFPEVTDMLGGGPFRLAAGQWTDDTSMALCLTDSLLVVGGFDPGISSTGTYRWYRHGERSSTGTCFDIGTTTCSALERYERSGEPEDGADDAARPALGVWRSGEALASLTA